MSAHRTHDITNPRPDETVRFDKPNACNQCHLDWSVNRAIAETQRLWPKTFAASQTGGERFDEPEGRRALFEGDAVMRALTAAAMMPATDVTAPLLGSNARSLSHRALFRGECPCRPIPRAAETRLPGASRDSQRNAAQLVSRAGRRKRCAPRKRLAND